LTQNQEVTLHNGVFSFHTISAPATGYYREKGSKFIAFAYPVTSEEEIRMLLHQLRKEYFDARHHCYAWILGPNQDRFRANDDGEPNHTAGDPILGQIRSHYLTNVLVVVVRYFGGTKLGVSGLIQAYRIAAAQALKSAVIIEEDVTVNLSLEYDYACSPDIMKLVKELGLIILNQNFDDHGRMEVKVKVSVVDKLKEKIERLQALKLAIRFR
jgi:uncharacterized YigZ family protein